MIEEGRSTRLNEAYILVKLVKYVLSTIQNRIFPEDFACTEIGDTH